MATRTRFNVNVIRTLPVLLNIDIWVGNRIRVVSFSLQALVRSALLQDEFAVGLEDARMWREINLRLFLTSAWFCKINGESAGHRALHVLAHLMTPDTVGYKFDVILTVHRR